MCLHNSMKYEIVLLIFRSKFFKLAINLALPSIINRLEYFIWQLKSCIGRYLVSESTKNMFMEAWISLNYQKHVYGGLDFLELTPLSFVLFNLLDFALQIICVYNINDYRYIQPTQNSLVNSFPAYKI